ncbi:hypothetical protein KY284_032763 [Solanum tuberosum]|nr:hypothetical protein KY284_032763 [Solanum tuberosum]
MPNVNIVALISLGTYIHRDTTQMANEMELAKQSISINKIPKSSVDSVMQVLVIRRGSVIPYKNSRHEGTFRTMILVDEERDFAENDGAFLEKLQDDKPILALCDVRVSIYKGIHNVLPIWDLYYSCEQRLDQSNVPKSNRPSSLCSEISYYYHHKPDNTMHLTHLAYNGREIIKADNKDITITPTKDCMYKFKETIEDILNKDEPWYSSCKKCHKKVKVIEENVACTNCNSENAYYEMRYCLQLEVCGGEQYARVIVFEATKYLLGCSVQEYIESTSVNKEECYYYRKLMLSKDKQFDFLVRIDMNDSNPRRSIIVEEIHQAGEKAPIIMDDKVKAVRMYRKRAKKTTDGAAQINLNKPQSQ